MIVDLITIALLLIAAAVLIGAFWPSSPETALVSFRKDCRDSGMSFAEGEAAIAIRVAFVQLRRLASDQCMRKNGAISRDEIDEIAGNIAGGISSVHGHDAAKSFIGWVGSCPDSEILYDDARAKRHAKTLDFLKSEGLFPPKPVAMSQDLKDALKII